MEIILQKEGWKDMREQLTESDVKKIEEEIQHRKHVIRKEAIEAVKEEVPFLPDVHTLLFPEAPAFRGSLPRSEIPEYSTGSVRQSPALCVILPQVTLLCFCIQRIHMYSAVVRLF